MKGAKLFWIVFIPAVLMYVGINYYDIIIKTKEFQILGGLFLLVWEVVTASNRYVNDYKYNEEKNYFVTIKWAQYSIIYGVYVGIKYYVNPFLNKIFNI